MARQFRERLLERLAAVEVEHPALDQERAQRALEAHLGLLRAAERPVRWTADAEAGLAAASGVPRAAEMGAHWKAKKEAVRALELMVSLHDDPRWPRELWPPARGAARCAPWETALWKRLVPAHASAVELAADAAAWSAVRSSAPRFAGEALLAAIDRWIEILLPLVDAYEAGLWLFWVLELEVVVVPRPALRIEEGRLHSADGPAVFWPGGPRYWFWRGVQVPRGVIEAPETLTAAEIAAERNFEVRRAMIERFGYERYLRESDACKAAVDDAGTLRRLELPADEPLVVVEVLDATPRPDGFSPTHFLRVPPRVRTPREAVAWTFGFDDPRDYDPEVAT